MLASPVAGRRPEKLRLNLNLLFTEEGGEYSMPEARARSMGLLGKRWGPPLASELSCANSSKMRVNFNDDGTKNTRNYTAQRSLAGGEPTVTINTKAALADVFGMYNSPEKSTRLPGTKHAPVHAVERVTPISLLPQTRPASVENAGHSTTSPSEGEVHFLTNTLASLNSFQVLHPSQMKMRAAKKMLTKYSPFLSTDDKLINS
jgi:checkpoint serine/threonine-protein kinase